MHKQFMPVSPFARYAIGRARFFATGSHTGVDIIVRVEMNVARLVQNELQTQADAYEDEREAQPVQKVVPLRSKERGNGTL